MDDDDKSEIKADNESPPDAIASFGRSRRRTNASKVDKVDNNQKIIDANRSTLDATPTFLIGAISPHPSGPSPETIDAIHDAIQARVRTHTERKQKKLGSKAPSLSSMSTICEQTLRAYNARANNLVRRYQQECGIDDNSDFSPTDWVLWLQSLKPSFRASTWRQYRAACLYFLEGVPDSEKAASILCGDFISPSAKQTDEESVTPKRTSALKKKSFPLDDFTKVCLFLKKKSRSALAKPILEWLLAGIITGLRPSEWQATEIEIIEDKKAPYGRQVILYVVNAKATNGRANGVTRTLILSNVTDRQIKSVSTMSALGRKWLEDGVFPEMQARCATKLYKITRIIWPNNRKPYSLYSVRHQAIANWKSLDMPPETIAALVGHGVTATAAEHYGRRRSGWSPDRIPPAPIAVDDEVNRIKKTIKHFTVRAHTEKLVGSKKISTTQFPIG